MKKIIIAIDGFSSTGKSTIAKRVAQGLEYAYIDTGAMYRAITYLALKQGLIFENNSEEIEEEKLLKIAQSSNIEFRFNKETQSSDVFVAGENVEKQIRGIAVSQQVSQVAKLPKIREFLVHLQQEMGKNKGIVMDGRDIGTVVFPHAELKIFLTASEEIRAERRYKELISKGENVTLSQVKENIRQRDYIDTHREQSPLRKAPDAIELDNSHTSIEQISQEIITLALQKIRS